MHLFLSRNSHARRHAAFPGRLPPLGVGLLKPRTFVLPGIGSALPRRPYWICPASLEQNLWASGAILKSNAVTPAECLHYALNLPTSVVINGIDSMKLLGQAFEVTNSFKSMSSHQVAPKTARPASGGQFERFKRPPSKHPEYWS